MNPVQRLLLVTVGLAGVGGALLGAAVGLLLGARRQRAECRTPVVTLTSEPGGGWLWEVATGWQTTPTVSGTEHGWTEARTAGLRAADELALRGSDWAQQNRAKHAHQ